MNAQRLSLGLIWTVFRCERGATAIEYALVAGLISMAILGGATVIGQKLGTTFSNVASNLK